MPRVPSYRHFKPRDLAVVDFGSTRIYLGRYNSPESRTLYHVLLSEWEKNGRREAPSLPQHADPKVALVAGFVPIRRLAANYLRHLRNHEPTEDGRFRRYLEVRLVMRFLCDELEHADASKLTAEMLENVRLKLVRRGLARSTIRSRMNIIEAAIRRAAKSGLIPKACRAELEDIDPLPKRMRGLNEGRKVPPVAEAIVNATLPHLNSVLQTMVRLQLLSGARPGEVCIMRPIDLETTGRVWFYRPPHHKTDYRGKERIVPIGPAAQALIGPYLAGRPVTKYLFSPEEAEAGRREVMHAARITPLSCGNHPGTNRKDAPGWKPGACYTSASYRRAVTRACKKAGVPVWAPNQLRHAAATHIRREAGLEVAALALGHSSAQLTDEVYAERDFTRLAEVMARIG